MTLDPLEEALSAAQSGRLVEAVDQFDRLIHDVGHASAVKAKAYLFRSMVHRDLGNHGGARADLDSAVSLLERQHQPVELTRALLMRARNSIGGGEPSHAESDCHKALALAHGDSLLRGQVNAMLLCALLSGGSKNEAFNLALEMLNEGRIASESVEYALEVADRLARELGTHQSFKQKYADTGFVSLNTPPSCVYRLFEFEEHARGFARGRIRLSTLGACRRSEDWARRDIHEAVHTRAVTKRDGNLSDPVFRKLAAQFGVFGSSGYVFLRRNRAINYIPDAWLLCTTTECGRSVAEKMGRFAVKIDDPLEFSLRITAVLGSIQPLNDPGLIVGSVRYANRQVENEEAYDGLVGFIKDRGYQDEKEFRMLWQPMHSRFLVEPRTLEVPAAAALVSYEGAVF